MHDYSTDSSERRFVPLLLAARAIAFAWLSSKMMDALPFSVLGGWLRPRALYALFDKHLWRNRLVPKLGLSGMPDLNGRWRGFLVSSFDGHVKRHDVLLQVFQNLDASCRLSHDLHVHLAKQRGRNPGVRRRGRLFDLAIPKLAYAMKSMHMHHGTAMLRLSEEGDRLTGGVLRWPRPAYLRTNLVLEKARGPCHAIPAHSRNCRSQAEGLIVRRRETHRS